MDHLEKRNLSIQPTASPSTSKASYDESEVNSDPNEPLAGEQSATFHHPTNTNVVETIKKPSTSFMIFQIGYHKCGTRTSWQFFHGNHVRAVHHRNFDGHYVQKKGISLREIMNDNYANGRPIMDGLREKYTFFSDYGTSPRLTNTPWYQLLSQEYPDTKFILQIRGINGWLHSRFTHYNPWIGWYLDRVIEQKTNGIKINGTFYNLTKFDELHQHILVLQHWTENWYNYMCNVIDYFGESNLLDNLLIFDITRDSPDKLVAFLTRFGMALNSKHYRHAGTTAATLKLSKMRRQFRKWDRIVKAAPEFGNMTDGFEGELERIMDKCNCTGLILNG